MKKFEFEEFPIEQEIAVIGGGLAGIITSIELSKYFSISIIEKEKELGGNLINVDSVFTEGQIRKNPILNLIDFLHTQSNVNINLNSKILDIEGNPGNYVIKIDNSSQIKEIKVGAICICIGLKEQEVSDNEYKTNKVINQTDFTQLLKNNELKDKKTIIMINNLSNLGKFENLISVSSNIYSLVNAIEAKKRGFEIIYLFENMNTPFLSESLYRLARETEIQFIKGSCEILNSSVLVKNQDKELKLNADLIVVSNPLILNDEEDIIKLLTEVDNNDLGYFSTIYNKLYQNQTIHKGIFLAGSCLHPMTISETVQHARAASLSIYNFLINDKIKVENSWSEIIEDKCIKCKNCIHICPFKAIEIMGDFKTDDFKLLINKIRCRGCGICSSVCPTDAILIKKHSDEDLDKGFKSIIKNSKENPLILGYICSQCASFSMKITENLEIQQNPNVILLPVTCAGKLSPLNIIKPLSLGSKGVLILKCPEKSCHFVDGSIKFNKNLQFSKSLIKSFNLDPNRIECIDIISTNYPKIKEKIDKFIEKIR